MRLRQVALVARDLEAVVEDLAHHYTQAGDVGRAVDYSLRAARKAQTLFNPAQQAAFLLQAYELMPEDDGNRRLPGSRLRFEGDRVIRGEPPPDELQRVHNSYMIRAPLPQEVEAGESEQ